MQNVYDVKINLKKPRVVLLLNKQISRQQLLLDIKETFNLIIVKDRE